MPPRTHSPLNFLSLGQILAACTCSTLIAVCAGGQVDPAAALAEQRLQTDRATGEPVRLATRSARLRIDDPASARSAAWIVDRAGDGVAAKAGGQDRRITLHAAVVAQAPAPLLRAAGFDAEPIAGVSGFARVDAASVSDAVVLAETVRALPGVVDASIASSRSFASRELPNDLALPFAWHLRNLEQPGNDVSAQEAWGLGYTGAGVRIGIMDEGVLTSHNDLAANHDASLSQVGITSNHGTSVAGIAAAVANNFAGAAGLAHGATFGQQYYFLGFDPDNIAPITNAEGFTFANDRIDIRNNSWGPIDTGAYDRLDPLEAAALETVTEQGRGGLGGIVVWAAGNGGGIDRVDYDGFASSRHTISIGAIGFLGTRATYNERGSSMLAVAWSDGNRDPDTFEARSIFAPSASSQFGFTQSFG
ncbi:MAG: S8 family serine peptidase, partial [Planctomycetota bacterium]